VRAEEHLARLTSPDVARTRAVVAVVMGLGVAVAAIALARGGSRGTGCGHGHTLPQHGHRYDVPQLGPLTLQAGFRGDFVLGYPYKVGITRRDMSQRVIVVRGSRCADGRPLHFFYRDQRYYSLPRPPLTTGQLQRLGDSAAWLRWYQAPPGQSALGYAGYMLFWAHGDWKLQVLEGDRVVGQLVLRI
jgi:hypothetical protein